MGQKMKRPILAWLFAVFALASCETAHNAAVSTFRVIDAPHVYMRHKLGLDEEQPQTPATTTTTTTQTTGVYSDSGPYPASQPYPPSQPYPSSQRAQSSAPYAAQPPPPPPVETQRSVVTAGRQETVEPQTRPTATPRVARHESPPSTTASTPPTSSSQNGDLPYAKPVPGKPGYVFSPFDKNGGYVDVTGYSPGQKVKDPYSGRIFLVP
jgi:hypothetical protein